MLVGHQSVPPACHTVTDFTLCTPEAGGVSTDETEAREVKGLARVPHWEVFSEVGCCKSRSPFSSLFPWHFLFNTVTAQMLVVPQHSQSSLTLPSGWIPFPSVMEYMCLPPCEYRLHLLKEGT